MIIQTKIKLFALLGQIFGGTIASDRQFKTYEKNSNASIAICQNENHIKMTENNIVHQDYVQKQYKMLPYPPVSKQQLEHEITYYNKTFAPGVPLITSIENDLETINDFLFQGKENFSNVFTAFVVGGGTGAITLFLAEQLRHNDGEVVYLDFSDQSRSVVEKRARIRKLHNMIFITDWVESIYRLGLYKSSYIQSSGVLHHLKSPSVGLMILKSTLKNLGGMSVMVYGKSGRSPYYHTQELLKEIGMQDKNIKDCIKHAKNVLYSFPQSNWLSKMHDSLLQHKIIEDEEIYDRYLHHRDVSFLTYQVVNFVNKAGLSFVQYTPDVLNNHIVQLHDEKLVAINPYKKFSHTQQLAIIEVISSAYKTHNFYASSHDKSQADINELENLIYVHGNPIGFRNAIKNIDTRNKTQSFWIGEVNVPSSTNHNIEISKDEIFFKKFYTACDQTALKMLLYLIRSEKAMNRGSEIGSIYNYGLQYQNNNASMNVIRLNFMKLYKLFKGIGLLLIRSKNTLRPTMSESISYYKFKNAK